MSLYNTNKKWGAVAQSLHWVMALLIISEALMLYYAQRRLHSHEWTSVTYRAVMDWHKPLGFLTLALLIARLGWRARDPRPDLPATMQGWQTSVTHVTHVLLYILMAACMFSGWGQVSSNGSVASVFGLFTLPALAPKDEHIHDIFDAVHYWTSWSLFWLVVFHAAAALKHRLVDRDNVLASMLPWR